MSSSSSQPHLPVELGAIVANKYRVLRFVGRGAMGVVVEGRHIGLDERCALKFLLPESASHPEASLRFLNEARAAAKIKSEHVARVSDVGTLNDGSPYMAMEFLEGYDLASALQMSGPLAIVDALDFIIQACDAIAEAHAHRIIHRDLKPGNIFLARRLDGSPLVKVLDFGISKIGDGIGLTRSMLAMGSALYMSPEQMQQAKTVDHRTDIYALGVTLHQLLAGRTPFFSESLPQLCTDVLFGTPAPLRASRPDVPPELALAIAKAHARDPAQRYTSVADFVAALAPYAPPRSAALIERIQRIPGPSGGPARAASPSTNQTLKLPNAPSVDASQPQAAASPRTPASVNPSPPPRQAVDSTPDVAPLTPPAPIPIEPPQGKPPFSSAPATSMPISPPRPARSVAAMAVIGLGIIATVVTLWLLVYRDRRAPAMSAAERPATAGLERWPSPVPPSSPTAALLEVGAQGQPKHDRPVASAPEPPSAAPSPPAVASDAKPESAPPRSSASSKPRTPPRRRPVDPLDPTSY